MDPQIDAYRTQILAALTRATNKDGLPLLDEKQAQKLVMEFSDEELRDGMDFNTPEEVAQLLLESGL